MKKLATFIGLALVMLTTSCSQDVTTDVTPTTKVTLGLSIDATRTYIGNQAGNQYEVLWSEGDKIAVNGVEVAVPAQFVGKSNLEFAVDAAEEYNIAYPAEAVKDNVLTISEVQKFVDGSFAVGSGVLVGYTTTEKATLKNLYGFIKFTVSGAANVNAVTVTAEGGEAISGTFAVDYKNATISPLAGKDIIRVTDVKAAEGKATVVVAVPAGEYAKGFSVKVKDNANGVMTKSLKGTTGATVEAGVVYSLPEVAYAATAKEVVIMTAEDLAAFAAAANTTVEVAEGETAPCPYADWVSEDGEVKLGADIDMTDVDFTPIASFDGVFNGQGYAIKNWNATQGLFTKNLGTVKNVVIDASCTLTVTPSGDGDQNFAFVVDYNASSGIVAGCVNNGAVSAPAIASGANRIAGVVGASYGLLRDCINNGDITIDSETASTKVQNIGGVVGYLNPNASGKEYLGEEFVVNCINNGDLSVSYEAKPGNVCLGGVAGGTQATKLSEEEATYLGAIKDCINNGKVSYSFTVLDKGTYGNVGGVIGYAQSDIVGCDNYGEVSYTLPVPENRATQATCPSCAGVVGKTLYSVTNCNNYGKVNVEGIWNAGTSGATRAGGTHQQVFAGVVGFAGVVDVSDEYSVTGCNNYGEVNVRSYCNATADTQCFTAGVVGGASIPVSDCHNYGKLDLKTFVGRVWFGGVLGYSKSDIEKCTNESDEVTFTVLNNTSAKASAMGGVVGQAGIINDCHGNGDLKFVAEDGAFGGETLYTSGVAGYASQGIGYSTFSANVTLDVKKDIQASVRCAGVVGQVITIKNTTIQTALNCSTTADASVTLNTANTKANYVAGVAAYINNGLDACENKAAVTLNVTEANTGTSICYVAGVAGAQKQEMTACKNSGTITANMAQSTCPLYVAGVLADNNKEVCTVSGTTNSGNIVVTDYAGDGGIFGGVVAKAAEMSTISEDCTSTGTITVNGETL